MKLLIVCTHNRCRSILGEAIASEILAPNIDVQSAGSEPEGKVHPLSLKYLAQRGYSITGLKSKSWDVMENWKPDIIITVCDNAANEACPIIFGPAEKVHWGLVDPSKSISDSEFAFMQTIDLLENRFRRVKEAFSPELSAQELASMLRELHQ
ncbi:arsenate reductase ArsC [uncultured Umboniibacter sp.]|uniref:arsenate reductase ArsC n=1 Tax=uncultured Umboniibacter sp. TaxID=1798917 RepID=UPI0026240EBA|nr:arsenate reductase ArsC [uncultured Umboniibacter sp.]